MSMLYLQCIVQTRTISCIRDLTPKHLPMLRNIRQNALKAAKQKYGVENGDLRMFVHYQPSFCKSFNTEYGMYALRSRVKITFTSILYI